MTGGARSSFLSTETSRLPVNSGARRTGPEDDRCLGAEGPLLNGRGLIPKSFGFCLKSEPSFCFGLKIWADSLSGGRNV